MIRDTTPGTTQHCDKLLYVIVFQGRSGSRRMNALMNEGADEA